MNNTSLEALKNHLFATLEGVKNLNDPAADEADKCPIEQAKMIVNIADSIIDIAKVQVEAAGIMSKADNYRTVGKALNEMGISNNIKMIEG